VTDETQAGTHFDAIIIGGGPAGYGAALYAASAGLQVAVVEKDKVGVFIEDGDVGALTRDCQQTVTAQAQNAGVHLEVVTQDGVGQVRADRTRLKQVLLNLLSNGVKYNRRGGRVSLILQELDGQITFRVRDNGLGMTRAQIDHLFEPFNRLGRENSSTPGTGIGLVICKRLLEMMGSQLTVRAIEDEGSEFMFSLPSTNLPRKADTSRLDTATPTDDLRDGASTQRKVLCVEDNQTNRDIMVAMLALRPQIELVFETSGQGAMDRIERETFDLILLDMHLPDAHGLDLLAWLKQDPQRRVPPVVIVSADVSPDTIARAERAGAQHYLRKPLDLKLTLDMLDTLLQLDAETTQPAFCKV